MIRHYETADLAAFAGSYIMHDPSGYGDGFTMGAQGLSADTRAVLNTSEEGLPPFSEISISWNGCTEQGSIEVAVSLHVCGRWSGFASYGVWRRDGLNDGVTEYFEDDIIRQTDDRVFVKNGLADGVRLRAAVSEGACLRRLSFTVNAGKPCIPREGWLRELENVPQMSQMTSGHVHAGRICSPVSLWMLTTRLGLDLSFRHVARSTHDTGNDAYGNWPQNMAAAGDMGFRAFTMWCPDLSCVKDLIARDIPVAASIITKDISELHGSTMAYPYGHLLVIKGFAECGGREFVIVHDPAANEGEEVRRLYAADEFTNVWKKYIYVVTKEVSEV